MQSWREALAAEQAKPYFQTLMHKVSAARAAGETIYPPAAQVFKAFELTELDAIKVVIIGQDPYHGPGQAEGLCFSVPSGVKPPPSLKNIYKAIAHDYPDFQPPMDGSLQHWAEQGVFLLNTVLTVAAGRAHSHAKWGWETFTDKVIETINNNTQGVVFLLWGAHAQKKASKVDAQRHHILTAVHPSPLSAHRGFIDCGHFRATNDYLSARGKQPIQW